jgi:hypothetical protein
MKLHHITDINDPQLAQLILDDPVRPHIPLEQRVNNLAEIMLLKAGDEILAATCLQWLRDIPQDEADLVEMAETHDVAVFYTIWSYAPGAGAELLKQAAEWLKTEYKDIKNIVTLSPQTEMARRFHTKNGATVHRTNKTSVNYRYYPKDSDAS